MSETLDLVMELIEAASDLDAETVLVPGTQKATGTMLISAIKYQRLLVASSAILLWLRDESCKESARTAGDSVVT